MTRRIVLGGSLAVAGVIMMSMMTACSNQETARPPESLDSVVSRVVKASPNRESTSYAPPPRGTSEAVAASVAELMTDGSSDRKLDSYDLEPVTTGTDDGAAADEAPAVSALVERGDPTEGNGLYVVRDNRDAESALVVQIPHPVADRYTERMGAQLFSESDARLFMMAGAHRKAGDDSADVAHRSDSTFAAVSDAIVQEGMTVVQIHGFSSDNHDDFGDVVLSSTVDEPSPAVRQLEKDLSDHGFDTCTYDGKKCKALAATTNVQAIAARARGADFIHIEVNKDIRKDKSDRRELMRVIAESLRSSGIG